CIEAFSQGPSAQNEGTRVTRCITTAWQGRRAQVMNMQGRQFLLARSSRGTALALLLGGLPLGTLSCDIGKGLSGSAPPESETPAERPDSAGTENKVGPPLGPPAERPEPR